MAGYGLSVETTVKGSSVFFLAKVAHNELLHCCVLSVVGQPLNNSVTRTTICACDEKVVVTLVFWISQFV